MADTREVRAGTTVIRLRPNGSVDDVVAPGLRVEQTDTGRVWVRIDNGDGTATVLHIETAGGCSLRVRLGAE
jgi:hypothetical protein